MGYSDFVAKLRPDLFDAYGDDQQDPVKLPDIQNPSLPPVQIAPTQQNIPAPEIDPHQAAIESIFGKARPNFGIALPETNLKPATSDYQPPKVKARVGSVSSAKIPKQTGTIEGSVEAKNPYTGASPNPALPNELGGNFKTYDDLMNWKPSRGFDSGAPLAQYVDLQSKLKGLPRPDRDFKTLDEFNQWYREAQQGQNAQNQPQRQQQQSSQSVRNRAAEAAKAMKHLEYTKQQALDLFDQANNTQNVGQDSELRQRAEYQLEAANELGRKYAKSYGDLLEIGFGSDPNSTYPSGQPRQWVYVKPKDSQVTYESTRQDLQSGQRRKGRQADAYKQQQIDRLEGVDTGQTYIDPKAEQDARDIQGQGVLHGAFNRFAGAAIRGATAIPEGFARIGDTIAGYAGEAELAMDPEFQKMSPEQQSEIRRKVAQQDPSLGDRLEGVSKFGSNLADDVVPIDKSRKGSINPLTGEFWEVTMPEAAGSMVPFMASSAVGGALGLPSRLIAGTVGAAMEVPEQYAEARDAGGTPEQMRRATLTGVGAGALEAVGAESLMGKLGFHGKSPVGHLAHEAIQEGLQEGSQQFVENVGAKYFSKHDPNRSLSKDVLENAVPALFLGAGGAAMGMPGHLREQRAEVDQVAAERQSSPGFTPSAPEGTQTQVTKLRTVAQQIKDLADASPEHPVVQTVKQLGIDPATIPQANDQAIEALSEGLKTIAETHTQFAELEQQKGTADQQLQNVQDQLRMGRVPTDAEQQQAQQGQVVAQQIEQNIQQQQAVIDDLAQNVSPLFKNLAKAIGAKEKSIEPIGDAADDATKSLVSEVRKVGGISASEGTVEKGELDRLSPKESGTTGLIRREGGTSADQMREQMASEGLTKAETAHEFIQEVEDELKRPKKAEPESFDDYQRGKLSDTEASDSDLLDTLSKDRAHPFTRVYRALDNTKTVYTPRLAKDFVREADKAGFSGDFIENALVDFQNRRGMLSKEETPVPESQPSNRTVSQYRQMTDANKPAIEKLHTLNLNSDEAKTLIAGIRQFNQREGISPHHLGNLLDGIKDWQVHHPPKGMEGRRTPGQPQASATRKPENPQTQPARSNPTPEWMRNRNISLMDGPEVTEFVEKLREEKARQDAQGWETIDRGLRQTTIDLKDAAEKHRQALKDADKKSVPALKQSERGAKPKNKEERAANVEHQKEIIAKSEAEAAKIGKKEESATVKASTIENQPVSELDDATIAKRIQSNETIENTMKGDVEYGKSEIARKRREYVGKLKEEQRRRETSDTSSEETDMIEGENPAAGKKITAREAAKSLSVKVVSVDTGQKDVSVIHLNLSGLKVIAIAIRSVQGLAKSVEIEMNGAAIQVRYADKIVEAIRTYALSFPSESIEQQNVRNLADAIEKVVSQAREVGRKDVFLLNADASSKININVIQMHEVGVHGWQNEIGEPGTPLVSKEWMATDVLGAGFGAKVWALGYRTFNAAKIEREALAFILSGDFARLGFTDVQSVKNFVSRYLTEVARVHGVKAVEALTYYDPIFKETIDAVIAKAGGVVLEEQAKREKSHVEQAETAKNSELQTLSHSNPALDGKEIIRETDDGKVIVANPENKTGISVVKPQERNDIEQNKTELESRPGEQGYKNAAGIEKNAVQHGSNVERAAEGETGTLGDVPVSPRDFSPEQAVQLVADSVDKIRKQDVYRLFDETPQPDRAALRDYVQDNRPDLAKEIVSVIKDLETEGYNEQAKEAKSDERSSDSTRSDENKPGDDRGPGDTASSTDAGTVPKPEKTGTKPRGSVSKRGGRGTTRGSQPAAPSLFGDNSVQSSDQSDSQQTATKAELIADVEAQTQELSSGEAVIQAAVADLPPEPEPENEPEPPVAEIIRPAKPKPEPLGRLTAASMTITPEIAKRIQSGGQMTKYKQNIAAIHTMRQILQEGRRPTVDEQETMAMYAGFGGIKPIFYPYDHTLGIENRDRQKWIKAQDELRELIGDKAYDAARDSTKNAHFTDPHIVQSMWQVAKHLGFTGGRMLEPSVGVGNFIGLMPEDLRGTTSVTGVELDLTTGEMARMLYPDANINIQGFEKLNAPDGFYDLAIGNVPFGDYTVSDSRYNKFSANIHNYFFLKAMDKVRPGGLVMFITSTGTMDAARAKIVRKALAEQADLVTAIRFPAETFAKTALTSVVTDLVILRKRLPNEEAKDKTWIESGGVENPDGGKPITLNSWLDKNRQNILGDFNGQNRQYPGRANVDRTDDFEDRLRAVIDGLPKGIMSSAASSKTAMLKEAGANVKTGGYVIDGDRLMANVKNKGLVEIEASPDRIRRATGLLGIRDVFNKLSDAELGRSSENAEKLRRDLNSSYDAFVARHGIINDKKNLAALADDPDLPRLQALENYDSKTKRVQKMPIFTKSTVVGSLSKSKPTTIVEGVVKSFSQTGKIDPAMIAEDMGLDFDTVGSELVERGIAFHTPQGQWELAAHYLSGNVRRKLAEARLAVATDQQFQPNVDALERVVPRDVPHTSIAVEMGAPWMEPKVIADFVGDLFKEDAENTKVFYDRSLGTYAVHYQSGSRAKGSTEATTTWGTPKVPFDELLGLALTGKSPRVVEWIKDADGTRREVFLPAETQQAQTKMDAIKQRFKEWVWQDEERKTLLANRYNEQFNSMVPSRYDVSFMLDKPEPGKARGGSIPGMNPEWKLRPHQLAGVFRAVIEQRGLFAHEVGLGKTLTMIASASELKRLGIAKKPAIAVPKKVLPGFAATAREVFPLLKLHVIDAEDADSRNRTMNQVATGDYDLVLMTHDNMDMLKMRPEFEAEMLQKELDEVDAVYYAMAAANKRASKSSSEGRIMAQILKRRERLAAKIKNALDSERKDDSIIFEDTGIDFLMVDEFHKYKSLPVITALGQVKGVPTNDSQRATNMFMRVRYLQSIQRGGGIIGATGTPISNSLVEAYIVSKYLQPDLLEEAGVQSFDAWVRNFASVVSALEMGATQEWKMVSRLSEFKNLPELKMLSRMTLDVQTAEKTGILEKRPKRIDTVADVQQSETQQVYMKVLKERADRLKGGRVDPKIDNYLVLSTDGMMMALDPRLVLPDWKEEGSKLLALTENVMRIHKAKPGMAQMIFCDVGVGATAWGFRYYDAVIDKLASAGIPKEKIIDFSKLNTDAKVEKAVARLKSGDALVAIGHRENMGTGVNAQDKMAAVHQLDPPWKPSAIEQSEARAWREGNENEEVEIIPYVGRGSFDAVKWATVNRKYQGIRSFMADEVGTERTLEETDDDALSYDQIAAVASGDGDYLRKAELDQKVFKLENMERAHESDRLNREHQLKEIPLQIQAAERKIVELDRISTSAEEIKAKDFSYTSVKGEVITDKKEAAKILASEYLFTKDKKEKVNLGFYKGQKLVGDGYGWARIEIRPKGSYETKEFHFNVNTTEFVGTIQSLEKTIAGLADKGDQEYLRNTKIPMLQKDMEELSKVASTPFPFKDQLARAKGQLESVKKRLAAKETASASEDEPLVSKGMDVRAVASLGRQVRRGLREKELTPAEIRKVIDERMPEIEASTKDAVDFWQMVQRRKAEEFLEEMGGDTGLAGMAITAASARREQALYDPELDSTPPASLGPPKATELTNPLDALLYQSTITKSRGSRGVRMYVNDHARAILGAALTEVFQRDYTNINAINLARDEVYRLSTYLDKEAGNLPGEYKKGAEAFAQSLRQMVDDSKGQRTFNIVDITPFAERHEGEVRSDVDKAVEQFKGTIREESFHWSQRQVDGQSIALVGSSWAQSSKGYAKYRKALVDRGYPDDPETIAAEAAAKIAAGLYDELGIRSEADHQQAATWLASYFDRVAEKHGLDVLDKFDRLLQPAKAAKEKGAQSARERLAERIKQDKERATAASNRPRAPGSGGETVQKNEASQPERRQEPVYKADIDAPFEGGKIKGPQLPLSEQVNSQNVRLAGEEKPSVGGAGFGGKPPKGPRPLFNEEPAEPPKPWEREPKQRSFGEEEPSFDKVGNPTGRWKKFFENLSDVINIPKALRATFDLSATLRQAFYMAAPHPILGIKSFGRQIKSLKQVNYDQFYKWLKSHPAYKDAKAAGLEFSGDNPLNLNEENFGTRFAGKIPGIAMAERAFVTMLDSMRIEVFDLYRKTANKQFKDPRERFESHEAAASWINKTSGRADFGKGKYGNFMRNAAIPFLNVFGWSPRFVYSRFQMLNPWTYAQNLKNAPRRAVFVRQVAEIFQTAATLVATGALATAAGGNISLDEDDPDFLKIRFGTTRYDVLAGVQQAARLAIKIGKWIESRGMEDDEKKLKKISRDTAAAIPRFARTKLAPVPGFFTDWINDWVKVTGEVHRPGEFWGMAKEGDYSGAAAEFVNDPVLSLAMPMMFSNVVEAYVKGYRGGTLYGDEADHLKGLMKVGAIEPFEFMGLGVQDYDRPEWKKETEKKLEELDYDPKFPKRLQGEKEKDYQARVRRVIAEKENAITRFTSDPNMKSQPPERAKQLLRGEMSSEGMERLKKLDPEDIQDDRMVRAWILTGVERLKKNPVYQQMSEDDQRKALESYHARMNKFRAQPENDKHGYIPPDVVDEDLLKEKIDAAIRSRRPNQ